MSSESSAHRQQEGHNLLIVASNPATTSGLRTLGRADKARAVLGFDTVEIANLFSVPTYRTGEISSAGSKAHGWHEARQQLESALCRANGVLLAYGLGKPTGLAAKHQSEQVAWLAGEICRRELPVWTVGGVPRHPSRWQRYTYREYPGVGFLEALAASIVRTDLS